MKSLKELILQSIKQTFKIGYKIIFSSIFKIEETPYHLISFCLVPSVKIKGLTEGIFLICFSEANIGIFSTYSRQLSLTYLMGIIS
jgi:hypothetical protein